MTFDEIDRHFSRALRWAERREEGRKRWRR